MNSVSYDVTRLPSVLTVGRQTETGVMAVRIDCTGWLTFWPNLTLRLFVTAPNGVAAYPAKTPMDGQALVWDVSSVDTVTAGKGSLEVVGEAPGKRKLSAVTETNVLRTTTATTGEPPEQIKTWFEEVKEAADTATAAMAGVTTATANANAAADRANSVAADMDAATPAVTQGVSGNVITVSDSADRKLRKVMLYGKTTQNGTPTPSAPIPLVTMGADGDVKVSAKAGVVEGGSDHITIISQPRNVTTPVGANVVFHVDAVGDGLTYQWRYSADGGTTWGKLYWDGATTQTLTFDVTEARAGNIYRCDVADKNGNKVTTETVRVTIGNTTATENPVTVQTATVATPNGFHGVTVDSGGNYTDANGQQWVTDTIDYDVATGKAKYVRRVGVQMLDGSETSWRSITGAFHVSVPDCLNELTTIMSNRHVNVKETVSMAKLSVNQMRQGGTRTNICFGKPSEGMTVDEWKAQLAQNPIEFVYPLAKPVETELSADQFAALRSYCPITTVYNSAGAHMEVAYVLDTKTYIDERVDAGAIINDAKGSTLVLEDSAERRIRGLTVYGRTTQNGTPTPDAPVALVSLAEDGKVGVVTADKTPTITVTGQPVGPTGKPNDTFTFKARAEGEYLSYQWEVSMNGGKNWSNSTMASGPTDTLTLSARSYHNGYLYRCLITDVYGNTVRTNTVMATVGDTTPAIQLILNPADVTAPVGGIAVFRTEATGTGLVYQWQWQDNKGSAWANSSQTGYNTPVFSMPVESHRNGYKYRCAVADANGNTVFTDAATLTVGEVVKPVTFRTIVNAPNGLHGVPVTSGGNYTDKNGQQWVADSIEYDAATGKAKYVRRVERLEFDGSEEYQTLNGYFRIMYSGLKAGGSGLCSIGSVYNSFAQNGFYYNSTYVYFRFDSLGVNGENTTVAEVKEWVAAHPFALYAILAEPVETELSADQFAVLRNFYPTTVVYNSERAHMTVSYVADTKLYINGLMGVIENGTY